jgi:hypothetical protein
MGFYFLPRAEDMTATTYQGQDTCVVVRRKMEYGQKSVEVCQEAQRISSWTRGLISSEELEKYLSTIVPRLLQEKFFDDSMNILSLYPKNFGYSIGGYSHRERWPRTQ